MLSSELSAVRAGVGNTILNVGELPDGLESFAAPVAIKPPLFMTCCAIFSNDTSLSAATEAVRASLIIEGRKRGRLMSTLFSLEVGLKDSDHEMAGDRLP